MKYVIKFIKCDKCNGTGLDDNIGLNSKSYKKCKGLAQIKKRKYNKK